MLAKIESKLWVFNLPRKRVELKQGTLGRGEMVLIATASININQTLCTFHTSTVAFRHPRVHLPWPLIAISPSNDACFLGHMQMGTGADWAQCREKVIAPLKPSAPLSRGASIVTDGAHTPLDVLY